MTAAFYILSENFNGYTCETNVNHRLPALDVICPAQTCSRPVAQSDAYPTSDHGRSQVRSPSGPATFFRGDGSCNIIADNSLPSTDSRRTVVSFWRKIVYKYWLTA